MCARARASVWESLRLRVCACVFLSFVVVLCLCWPISMLIFFLFLLRMQQHNVVSLWGQRFECKLRLSSSAKLCMSIHYTDHHISLQQQGMFKSIESTKKGYPPFQAHSATQVCTGIQQNQFLFETGHSPYIWRLAQHINTHIHTFTRWPQSKLL